MVTCDDHSVCLTGADVPVGGLGRSRSLAQDPRVVVTQPICAASEEGLEQIVVDGRGNVYINGSPGHRSAYPMARST